MRKERREEGVEEKIIYGFQWSYAKRKIQIQQEQQLKQFLGFGLRPQTIITPFLNYLSNHCLLSKGLRWNLFTMKEHFWKTKEWQRINTFSTVLSGSKLLFISIMAWIHGKKTGLIKGYCLAWCFIEFW